jgi:2-polyprenyl-3-methyl-5-hydroxy-6-metoxy-1,4-benzoquinol methylase
MGERDETRSAGRRFWDLVGGSFPPFFDAPSTRYYGECERGLFERHFGDLRGKRLLKTDLWDEAKNTRILEWAAARRGAEAFGMDIARPILDEARRRFRASGIGLKAAVSDVRAIAFREGAFDALYSMGTCEHTPEVRRSIDECFRVLKPGGIAVIGVPNRWDVFLRPLLASVLQRLGLYGYGYEKSFGMAELEAMLTAAGFAVEARTGILFMPGWLRMADLLLHVHYPGASFLMRPLIAPFAWLYRRSDLLKRQGYLIVCVVRKPVRP